MYKSISAQVALLAFGVAILAGLSAGNSPQTILVRALLAMVAALVAGQLVSWAAGLVLRDHLQRKKLSIDREHLEASRPTAVAEVVEGASQAETG